MTEAPRLAQGGEWSDNYTRQFARLLSELGVRPFGAQFGPSELVDHVEIAKRALCGSTMRAVAHNIRGETEGAAAIWVGVYEHPGGVLAVCYATKEPSLLSGRRADGFPYDPADYHDPRALRRHADCCASSKSPLPDTDRYLCRAADEIERLRKELATHEERLPSPVPREPWIHGGDPRNLPEAP